MTHSASTISADPSATRRAPVFREIAPPATRFEQLMVLPVPLRVVDGRILFEQQACNGVARWADHFDSLLIAAPTLPETMAPRFHGFTWLDVDQIEHRDRMEFIPLPWAYAWRDHLRHLRATRRRLREMIDRSNYLHFGIGALFGDWAAEGARIAVAIGRPYAVHMDRVEDQHLLRTSAGKPLLKRARAEIYARLLRRQRRRLISGAALSMCHGYDTFAAYRGLNPHSFLVHNVHTTASDRATPAQIDAKRERAAAGAPLNVVYAGRIDSDKAPLDWIRAISRAVERGADLRATWLGEGTMRHEALAEVKRLGLDGRITFAGFIADRSSVLNAIRDADVLLFTHVTPESPRVLIESLICATPIVGYYSHYPADLIGRNHGGVLTPMGAPDALGDELADLAARRSQLSGLIESAARDGSGFTADAVFKHRSELIRQYLPAPNR